MRSQLCKSKKGRWVMLRKVLILTAIVSVFGASNLQAGQISVSWDGGGDGHSWGDANNWNPNIIPDNNASQTFAVTIDSGVGYVNVGLQQNRTIDQLDCYGQVELFNNTSDWTEFTMVDPNGLTNYGELEIEGEWRMQINGNVTNTTGKELELWGMMDIVGNLYNSADAKIKVGGTDIAVDGNLENSGTIVIDPESEFNADMLHNAGQIQIYGGQCEAETFDNNNPGAIKGFGFIRAEQLLRNKGQIIAQGGSLVVLSGGSITNTGTLSNKALSTLNIQPAEDVNNFGIIEVNAGGGVVFDCNVVNKSGAVINLLGGNLAATTITQTADANFAGFGGITGDILIETGGIIRLTGPTNIIGDVNIAEGATLEISDGQTLITGHTTCDGTIHLIGGTVIFQGGCDCEDCNIINEAGIDRNHFDLNADGIEDFKDFAYFAKTWLWQASWY